VKKMDIKRAKELINELSNLVDQIDIEELRLPEDHKTEIIIKVTAILNELDIRPIKYGD
jgi:hypothetical protein